MLACVKVQASTCRVRPPPLPSATYPALPPRRPVASLCSAGLPLSECTSPKLVTRRLTHTRGSAATHAGPESCGCGGCGAPHALSSTRVGGVCVPAGECSGQQANGICPFLHKASGNLDAAMNQALPRLRGVMPRRVRCSCSSAPQQSSGGAVTTRVCDYGQSCDAGSRPPSQLYGLPPGGRAFAHSP